MPNLEDTGCTCPVAACSEDCPVCPIEIPLHEGGTDTSCPADPEEYEAEVEGLIDVIVEHCTGWDGGVVDPTGGEPIASLQVGHDLWLDLHCTLRRVPPVIDPASRR